VLSRHFLTFFIVALIVLSPMTLIHQDRTANPGTAQAFMNLGIILVPATMLNALCSAIILHGAFQSMRKRPVNLLESLKVAFRQFLPLMALALIEFIALMIASILLIIPGLVLYTMWLVAMPTCVVERTGPWRGLRRSRELTKGYRWKIFWLILLLLFVTLINPLIRYALMAAGGETAAVIGTLIWTAIVSAFYSVVVAVTYYDLRVAKEGIDIEQIASVFD